MPQTLNTTLKIKYSLTTPTPVSLVPGEFACSEIDGKQTLFLGDSTGTPQKLVSDDRKLFLGFGGPVSLQGDQINFTALSPLYIDLLPKGLPNLQIKENINFGLSPYIGNNGNLAQNNTQPGSSGNYISIPETGIYRIKTSVHAGCRPGTSGFLGNLNQLVGLFKADFVFYIYNSSGGFVRGTGFQCVGTAANIITNSSAGSVIFNINEDIKLNKDERLGIGLASPTLLTTTDNGGIIYRHNGTRDYWLSIEKVL